MATPIRIGDEWMTKLKLCWDELNVARVRQLMDQGEYFGYWRAYRALVGAYLYDSDGNPTPLHFDKLDISFADIDGSLIVAEIGRMLGVP
jgi:hypothetical protein